MKNVRQRFDRAMLTLHKGEHRSDRFREARFRGVCGRGNHQIRAYIYAASRCADTARVVSGVRGRVPVIPQGTHRKALHRRRSQGGAIVRALNTVVHFASCDASSPSTYFRLWGAKVKGNATTGKDPYYKDSVLVVGRGGKILYQQTLKDIVKDKFDFDAVIKAAKAGLI